MTIIKKEQGKLPYGRYSKRSNNITTLCSCLTGFLTVIVFIFIKSITEIFGLSLFAAICFFIMGVLLITYHSNLAFKAIKKFNQDLDFILLENKLQMMLKENLHSETRNLILLDFSNILLNYDKERALTMWKNVKEPPVNKFIYHAYEINFLMAEEKYEEAKSLIDLFKIRYPGKMYAKMIEEIELVFTISSTKEIIKDIESKIVFPKNNRNAKVTNMANLMHYYYTRGFIDKAKEYAVMIKNENAGFTEIDKLISKVLEEDV